MCTYYKGTLRFSERKEGCKLSSENDCLKSRKFYLQFMKNFSRKLIENLEV